MNKHGNKITKMDYKYIGTHKLNKAKHVNCQPMPLKLKCNILSVINIFRVKRMHVILKFKLCTIYHLKNVSFVNKGIIFRLLV